MKHEDIITIPGPLGPPIRAATPAPSPAPLPHAPHIVRNPDGTLSTAIPGNDAVACEAYDHVPIKPAFTVQATYIRTGPMQPRALPEDMGQERPPTDLTAAYAWIDGASIDDLFGGFGA